MTTTDAKTTTRPTWATFIGVAFIIGILGALAVGLSFIAPTAAIAAFLIVVAFAIGFLGAAMYFFERR